LPADSGLIHESAAANDMSDASHENDNEQSARHLPPWADCDCFCIHDYAGTGSSPCGWRGRLHGARHSETGAQLLCPRCGCATLLRIPSDRSHAKEV